MPRILLVPAGLAVVAAVVVDLLWTTLSVGAGAGPLTSQVSRLGWWISGGRRPHRRGGGRAGQGAVVVVTVLAAWITLTWGGWSLVFNGAERAVVTSSGAEPASVAGRIYYAGYSVFTLGNGDLRPSGPGWQLATVLAAGSGLVLVTLAITYLMPVTGAATASRTVAASVAQLGPDPAAIVARAWSGRDFDLLTRQLLTLAPAVHRSGQSHLVYPVVHFYRSTRSQSSEPIALSVLNEALALLRWGVAPEVRPPAMAVEPVQHAIDSFLDTLSGAFIDPADEPLPAPDLSGLRQLGIPTVDDGAFHAALDADRQRRRLVAGLLATAGEPQVASFEVPA